jgi:hypothetical protein
MVFYENENSSQSHVDNFLVDWYAALDMIRPLLLTLLVPLEPSNVRPIGSGGAQRALSPQTVATGEAP